MCVTLGKQHENIGRELQNCLNLNNNPILLSIICRCVCTLVLDNVPIPDACFACGLPHFIAYCS